MSEVGITKNGEPVNAKALNVLGQIYTPKIVTESTFIWHSYIQNEQFVPPHIHPTQDEWIYMLDGKLDLEFGHDEGNVQTQTAEAGDLVRMPMGRSHGYFNRSGADVNCVFGVSPARKLFDLFHALEGVTDPAELTRLSALHEVDFLPPPE